MLHRRKRGRSPASPVRKWSGRWIVALTALLLASTVAPAFTPSAGAHWARQRNNAGYQSRWNTTPIGYQPGVPVAAQTKCGQASNPFTPCVVTVQVTNGSHGGPNFASHPEWMAVLKTVIEYTFQLTDWDLQPMLSLRDGGQYTCATWTTGACAGTGSIIMTDTGVDSCNSTGCELGSSSSYCTVVTGISTSTCTMHYSEVKMSVAEDWAYTEYTTSSKHYSFGQALEHEIGHSLGLDHPKAGPKSGEIMQCFMAKGEKLYPNLTSHEIDGLSATYGRRPNLSTQPVVPPC